MTQEYLFVGNQHKAKVQKYKPNPEKIGTETISIKSTDCWIVSYTAVGENEGNANMLSAVNDYIMSNFAPTVLTNDSSAYYNKRLFLKINEFERKLRKLLYLKSALNKDDVAAENIKNLEERGLGWIFDLLFTDECFMETARKMVREKKGRFSKHQIVRELESITEDVSWNHLVGENAVAMLREEHEMVRAYRNDAMHAHNINMETFHKAQELFEKVNAQLDVEIGLVMALAEKPKETTEKSDYNRVLKDAMEAYESYRHMKELFKYATSPEQLELQEIARKLELDPDYRKAMKDITELSALQYKVNTMMKHALSPEILALQEIERKIALDPNYIKLREIENLD